MISIAVQGIRGGVGVTSVTAALASALHQLGESVLIIDFSPSNLLRLHFNAPFAEPRGWARAYLDGGEWSQSALRYTSGLDLAPFGQLNAEEQATLKTRLAAQPEWWATQFARLAGKNNYQWVLLDLSSTEVELHQQVAGWVDNHMCLLMADMSCHTLLHQQIHPEGTHFLVNQFTPNSQVQQDLQQLWLKTLGGLLPVTIHRDEALAESMAVKMPVGEYRRESLAAQEISTLASWFLIHGKEAVRKEIVHQVNHSEGDEEGSAVNSGAGV